MVLSVVALAERVGYHCPHVRHELHPRNRVQSLYGIEKHQKLVDSVVTDVVQAVPMLDKLLRRFL